MNTNTADNNHATIEFGTEPSSGNGGVGFIGSTVTASNLANMFFGTRTGASSFATHMTIKSDGNVGIGTTSPAVKLAVSDSGGGNVATFTDTSSADLAINLSGGVSMITPSTGTLALGTGNTERARVTSAGLSVTSNITQPSTNAVHFMGGSTASFGNTAGIGIAGGDDFHVNGSLAGDLVIAAAAGENIVLGTSASGGIYSRLRINTSGRQTFNDSGTANAHANFVGEVGVGSRALAFEHTVGGGEVGTIVTSASGTNYGSGSDYRLKENVNYSWDATTRLKQLKPARFNFIADETNTLVDGFLAHEVSSIVPEAITGEKDAMGEALLYEHGDEIPEGKSVGDVKKAAAPDYQQIDHSKLVPLLVKTIQELEARIKTLEDA